MGENPNPGGGLIFFQNVWIMNNAWIQFKKEKKKSKLGQRQSQTPFSSAFWFDFDINKLGKLGQKSIA